MCWPTITTRPWRSRWPQLEARARSGFPWPADPRPGTARQAGPRGGIPAQRRPAQDAGQGRQGPDPARTLRAAGLCQAGPGCGNPGQPPARRSVLRQPAGGLFPASRGECLPAGAGAPSPETRNRLHGADQRHRQSGRAGLCAAHPRSHGPFPGRRRARLCPQRWRLRSFGAEGADRRSGSEAPGQSADPALQRHRRPFPARQPLVPDTCPGERRAGRYGRALSRRHRGPAPELCDWSAKSRTASRPWPRPACRKTWRATWCCWRPCRPAWMWWCWRRTAAAMSARPAPLYFAVGRELGLDRAALAGRTFPSAGALGPSGAAPPDGRSCRAPSAALPACC